MREPILYNLIDIPTVEEMILLNLDSSFNSRYSRRNVYAEKTGEERCPKKGEWFVSGAIPEAYRAPNDLSQEYHIAKLVRARKRIITKFEKY